MRSKQKGFTLLELIIVLSILSFLTINVAVNLRNAFRARTKIQNQVDSMGRVRDTLRIIERDLNLAFHYRDIEEELRQSIKQLTVVATPTPSATPAFGLPPPESTEDPKEQERTANRVDPTTHFKGSDREMYFATLNSARLSGEARQADFIKVGYKVDTCTPPGRETSSRCLFRVQGSIVEGDIDNGGDPVFLLADVQEFELRYIGKGKQDWNKKWDSKENDAATRGALPLAVEITLTTESEFEGNKRTVSMQLVAGVHFQNNDPSAGQTATGGSP